MFNLENKAGKIRISLAAFALVAGSLGLSPLTVLAQKKSNTAPVVSQPPQSETAKERLDREEKEALMGVKTVAPNSAANNNGAEVDGAVGAPRRETSAPVTTNAKNAPQVIPDDGFITITGSTGQVDEAGVNLVDFRNYEVGFRNTAPTTSGTFVVRYNITSVKDAFRTAAAATNNYQLKIRFRDDDGTANGSRVQLTVFRTSVLNGSTQALVSFDSNILPGVPAQVFRTATGTFCPTVANKFDFGNFVYWAEVTLSRNSAVLNANFGSLQFTETETPCVPVAPAPLAFTLDN